MFYTGTQGINPYFLLEKAHVAPGMHVADCGCGSNGHIVFPAAEKMNKTGIVYAVDILRRALEAVGRQAKLYNIESVHTVWSNLEQLGGTRIPEKTLDRAFIINTLFQAKDQLAFLLEVKRLLKDKARLLVVDWSGSGYSFGRKPESCVNFSFVKNWALQNNFVIQEAFDIDPSYHGVVLYYHAA